VVHRIATLPTMLNLYYLRQGNEVNDGDIVFIGLCVCVYLRSRGLRVQKFSTRPVPDPRVYPYPWQRISTPSQDQNCRGGGFGVKPQFMCIRSFLSENRLKISIPGQNFKHFEM